MFQALGLLTLLVFAVSALPSSEKDTNPGQSEMPHTIHPLEEGEMLWYVAALYYDNAALAHFLAKYNNIDDPKHIPVGYEIQVPQIVFYEVKAGDSLSEISGKVLGTSRKYLDIARYNNIEAPYRVRVGKTLIIPLIPSLTKKPSVTPEEIQEEKPVVEEKLPSEEEIQPEEEKPEPVVEEVPTPVVEEKPEEEITPSPVQEEKPEPEPVVEEMEPEPVVEEMEPEPVIEKIEPEPEKPEIMETPPEDQEIQEKPPKIPPVRTDYRLVEVKKPEQEIGEIPVPTEEAPTSEEAWPPKSLWEKEEAGEAADLPEEGIVEPDELSPILDALQRWDRPLEEMDITDFRSRERQRERGVKLPMHSLLQISGYKSITVEYNKTHYFGDSDVNRYGGYYSGSSSYYDSDYGYDSYGGYSSYGSSYGSSSYGSSYGSQYGSGYGYGGQRSDGPNIEQELDIHIHGRIGRHTHVDVDYNDTGRSQFGGMGQKEQKIAVWYEGDQDAIIQKASFGDIQLELPRSRFLNMSRSLFGAQVVARLGDVKLTAFGTRTKGIKETWSSKGQSRRAGGGTGSRIMDINYIKERYYAINIGEDGLLHDSYLPIETNSEQIYIDDGIGTNNDSGISTAQGYFDFQYPGDDYSMDYATGQIEFLKNISTSYKIIVAYRYLGDDGGTMGNPDAVFADEDEDGVIDEVDDPSDPLGYVTIKESSQHGAELRNVYSLGNRNIGRRGFDLSIWREGGTDSFEVGGKLVAYSRIFGLDSDNDGLIDPELIDFEKGLLTFPSPTPFIIDDPASPYYEYRDDLDNAAIYSENPSYTDQKYVIQADYSYQMPSFYLGRLNILPESEVVKVNNRKLNRGIDYIMIYEVGSVEIFKELDEYDEITIDYEYMPFGGQFQQTIAGVWAEYSFRPRVKMEPKPQGGDLDSYRDGMSPFSQQGLDTSSTSGYSSSRYGQSSNYPSGYSSGYGDSYGRDGYDSYSSGSYGRRGMYGGSGSFGSSRRSSRTSTFRPSARGEGLNLSMGYIYNTGERVAAIPDVNSAPSRLQALVFGGNWGHKFNVARVFGILPFVTLKGDVPLNISLDGEAAYSRNNPNSVGYAMIDSMEGAKENSTIPTYKYSWKIGSIPVVSEEGSEVSNRAVFQIAKKDKDASFGNYMKNRETSAVEINPLSQATQQNLVMEMGYELDESNSWGSLSHSISSAGADYSDFEFLEIWMKVEGDDNVNLNIDFGVVSEDTDDDFQLDSEDLPKNMIDQNGDHKVDILDLDKENLPEEHKYKGNGSLDVREDTGWTYNDFGGTELAKIGNDNSVLDSEDLDGDVVLDTTNSYYEFTIPLNSIPSEWVRKETRDSGWMFLSIPLEDAISRGRSPSWGVVKHVRIWLEKSAPGNVAGKFQWYSMVVAGNRWERGLVVVNEDGKLSEDLDNQMLVGTKNNHEFEDYLEAYRQIENNEEFEALHPYVESAFVSEGEKKEQSLTLTYDLLSNSTGYTMRELAGQQRGDGQDFSKHRNIRFWLYGDGSGNEFILRLGSNVDNFGAGSPVTKTTTDSDYSSSYPSYPSYSYPTYSSSSYGGLGFYTYSLPIDFKGWRLITISLEDVDGDGHPDGLEFNEDKEPSISNIGEILVGISNNTQFPLSGEVWVNEIHLSDPYVRSGWARRFNLSTDLMSIFSLRAGYAKQDKDFENSAGQTGRTSMRSYGYSTSNYDYNVDTELRLVSWLPMNFSVSHRESESSRQYGMISSYDSGLTTTDNKTFSISFDRTPLPSLSFSYDKQNTWNERRGTEISDLYSSDLGYSLGSMVSLRLDYSHEMSSMDGETASTSSSTSSSYYYGRDRDSIIDSGGVDLRISPSKSFSFNPQYQVRRELERESNLEGEEKGDYAISSRDQRISLKPTLRKFFGIKPNVSGRYGFSENWFSGEKDASINTDLGFGISVALKSWFASSDKKDKGISGMGRTSRSSKPTREDTSSPDEDTSSSEEDTGSSDEDTSSSDEDTSSSDEDTSSSDEDTISSNEDTRSLEENTISSDEIDALVDEEVIPDEELDRLNPEQFTELMDKRTQEKRGNWIESEKDELKKKIEEVEGVRGQKKRGILRRSVETFSFNTDLRFSMNDYLRRLESGMGFMDIIKLEPESEFRTRSTKSTRFTVRANMDPLTWMALGTNMSLTNRFTKSSGTASDSDSSTIGGNVKFSGSKTSIMLKYDMTTRDASNRSGPISDSTSHNQSVTVRKNWESGVGSSLGVRTTLRNYERGGVSTDSIIIAPNFNIDYDLHIKGSMGIPLIRKTIALDHDLDVSNTFSAMVRRESLGVNREEKSEQYGTSLDVSYNLMRTLRSTLRLSVDYNHDRVEEGADYVSVSGSLMVRGEFK